MTEFTKPGFYKTRSGVRARVDYVFPDNVFCGQYQLIGWVESDLSLYSAKWKRNGQSGQDNLSSDLISPWVEELDAEGQLDLLTDDLLKAIADHAFNSQTPLKTKLCALIRPYLK